MGGAAPLNCSAPPTFTQSQQQQVNVRAEASRHGGATGVDWPALAEISTYGCHYRDQNSEKSRDFCKFRANSCRKPSIFGAAILRLRTGYGRRAARTAAQALMICLFIIIAYARDWRRRRVSRGTKSVQNLARDGFSPRRSVKRAFTFCHADYSMRRSRAISCWISFAAMRWVETSCDRPARVRSIRPDCENSDSTCSMAPR